jgi:tetratricopeptide (TPR) repeat protein
MDSIRRYCGVLVALTGSSVVNAQDVQVPARNEVTEAKAMIAANELSSARASLERRLAAQPRDVDALFLLGMISIAEKDHARGVDWFRRALLIAPSATRIRLELARSLYLEKRYEEAFRQFQLARAGNPPPGVVQTIERYLTAIRQEKNWSYDFAFSFAPDTNINNATSATQTTVLGLPFDLSEGARRHSGLGIAADGSVEYAPQLSRRLKFRLGAAVVRREYPGSQFDDTRFSLHAGPRLILKRWDISLVGTAYLRWYGGRRHSDARGARFEGTYYPNARSAIFLGVSAQSVQYPYAPAYDGATYAVSSGYSKALTPSSIGSLHLSASRQTAQSGDLANWSVLTGFGYQRDLPGGFSIAVGPSVGLSRFDDIDPFFVRQRRDWIVELPLSLLNRRIVFSRFTPRLTYTFVRRWSNVPLFDFAQHRTEIGVSTVF